MQRVFLADVGRDRSGYLRVGLSTLRVAGERERASIRPLFRTRLKRIPNKERQSTENQSPDLPLAAARFNCTGQGSVAEQRRCHLNLIDEPLRPIFLIF